MTWNIIFIIVSVSLFFITLACLMKVLLKVAKAADYEMNYLAKGQDDD